MSTYWGLTRVDELGSIDFSGTNAAAKAFGQPIDIKRIIAAVTVASTGAAGSIITVQEVALATGTTSPTDLGTFTIPTGVAADTNIYVEFRPSETVTTILAADQYGAGGIGGQYSNDAPDGVLTIDAGNQLRLVSNGGGDAGTAIFFVEYQEQPNVPDRFTATRLAFTPA